MTNQTLDNSGLNILDSTCSYKRIWPRHATFRIDIRKEVNPDLVMDCKKLTFPNDFFDIIYCDPPHLFAKEIPKDLVLKRRLTGRKSPIMWDRYGFWKTNKEWFDFIEKTNKEFFRCLKTKGILYYKLTESKATTRPEDLIIMMTNFELIEDNYGPVKSNLGKGKTHYLKFRALKC